MAQATGGTLPTPTTYLCTGDISFTSGVSGLRILTVLLYRPSFESADGQFFVALPTMQVDAVDSDGTVSVMPVNVAAFYRPLLDSQYDYPEDEARTGELSRRRSHSWTMHWQLV